MKKLIYDLRSALISIYLSMMFNKKFTLEPRPSIGCKLSKGRYINFIYTKRTYPIEIRSDEDNIQICASCNFMNINKSIKEVKKEMKNLGWT